MAARCHGAEVDRASLEEVKAAYPAMITRFPEGWRLAALDRRISLGLARLPLGPLAARPLVLAAHAFGAPWTGLCAACLSIQALGSTSFLMWALVGLALLPLKELLSFPEEKEAPDGLLWNGALAVLGVVCLLLWQVAVDAEEAFQASCLYCASWLYVTQICFLLSCFAGRRRPAASMPNEASKLLCPQAWKPALMSACKGDAAYYSFPSGDAAAATCFACALYVRGSLQAVPLATVALAALARVSMSLHHALDVAAGGALGLLCTLIFASYSGLYKCHALLLWSILCMGAMVGLFTIGPLYAALGTLSLCLLLARLVGCCLAVPVAYCLMLLAGYLLYLRVSMDQKDWVMDHLETFFKGLASQEGELPVEVRQSLERKRCELRSLAADPQSPFPSNVYSVYAYSPGGGPRPKPFAADWLDIKRIMGARLDDFSKQCNVQLQSVEVVLGIHTGGAMIAPLVAAELGCDLAYIRVRRYSDEVLGFAGALQTLREKLAGKHEQLYRISEAPARDVFTGKMVLMVDDAVGTGGTFRCVHKFCMEAGAAEAKGVALESITPGGHIWDLTLPRPRAQELSVPCFVPWGLR